MARDHQATDSYVGYVFQGMFALTVLLDAGDDDAVGIETADDVELVSPGRPSLYQLKHSLGSPRKMTEKNVGLWKALGIWMETPAVTPSTRLVFVTCAEIQEGSPLHALCTPDSDRSSALSLLEKEAERVVGEASAARGAGGSAPHAERLRQCELFLSAPPIDRERLIGQVVLVPKSFSDVDVEQELGRRLNALVMKDIRQALYRRLLEWWDRQVAEALLSQRPRLIYKQELLEKLHSLMKELGGDALPNDFAGAEPVGAELLAELGGRMERQIRLVNGGDSRVLRAAKARWQARNQRERWMRENLAAAAMLMQFDERLVREWADQHGPMRDDCAGKTEEEKCDAGKQILDWTHNTAPSLVEPPKPTWSDPFLVRGSYQQLAEELRVGWHPEYRDHPSLREDGDS